MSPRAQVDALTGLRGIAAWLVVLYHIRLSFAPSLPPDVIAVLGKGYLAVDLFFVLSGFVLWMTWGQRLATERWRAMPMFLQKRIARVWPLHAVVLAATIAFAVVIAATGRPVPTSYRWEELPLHILLLQNWGFTPELAWNDPSWSISTELAAYIGFALLVPLLARPGRVSVFVPIALLAVSVTALDRFYAWHGESELGAEIAFFGLARCLAQFTCGVAACMIWQALDGRRLRWASVLAFSVAALLWLGGFRETLVLPIGFSALVLAVAATSALPRNPLSSRAAVFLGEISYSTYLAHFLLWTLFKLVLVRDAADVSLALGALFLLATLAASVALHRFVEVPARDRLGRAPIRLSGNPRAA